MPDGTQTGSGPPRDWVRAIGSVFLLAPLMVACAGSQGEPGSDRVAIEQTLSAFYKAIVEDRDVSAACRYTAAGFTLKPALYLGANFDAERDSDQVPRPAGPPKRPRTCEEKVRAIIQARGNQYPFSAWAVDSIEIAPDGMTAEAVTSDGSSGLTKADGRWLMAWAFDG